MEWKKLIGGIGCLSAGGNGSPEVTDVVYDSRQAAPGAVFVAVPGLKKDGDAFIADALARGACAVVSRNPQPSLTVPWAQVDDPRSAIGLIGRALWGGDLDGLTVAGVTGTNGKTTTATLYQNLLAQRSSHEESWLFGTISYWYDGAAIDAPHTTPESVDIYRCIGRARRRPQAISMEVSSHSLALNRIAGLAYDVAVWTNLTQDHLDFHKTMEQYYGAKKRLFTDYLKSDGVAIVNIDDPWGGRLASEIGGARRCVTYGESARADLRIVEWTCDWNGSRLTVTYGDQQRSFKSRLTGGFNRYNIAALVAGGYALGFDTAQVQTALRVAGTVRGRMESVPLDAGFAVVVDYAHTPDALEKALATARQLTTGRLLCVFGCGGDRDRTKRPKMARAVAEAADEAYVTSDNPRTEDPRAIIDEILAGMPLDKPHQVVADRAEAIRRAIAAARPGDCVFIAGKGHENYQEIGGVRHHFDDREVAAECCNRLRQGRGA